MRNILMIAVVIASSLSACKKENNTPPAVDLRDKFVGTWTGNYTFQDLPSFFPKELPTTIVITKSQASPSEIEIKIVNGNQALNNQSAKAVISGNTYIYLPLTVNIPETIVKGQIILNGKGDLSSDGKSISESGIVGGSYQILGNPPPPPVPISGTWTSSLTKQ